MGDLERENLRLKNAIRYIKKKSDRRKRSLRDLNKKIELYVAMIDASISDASRFKAESEMWKDRYFMELEKNSVNNKD